MIKIYQKSINKSGHKNGDFIYASNIMDTRAVGVLGDFTSDSNAGDSEICCETVKQFINANLSNWCHNLVEGSEIVEQLANNVNKWLADNTSGSRTTLIVILYDSHKKKLYYIVQGDSGLAIVKKEQIKYINKGDTSALKIATGFLPVQSKFNTEIIVNVEPTDFIFAYTDGFWKNTKLHRNGGENKIIEILRKERWEQTEVSINENIFDTSPRKDDMTILVMKEDVMDKPPLTGLNPKTNSKKTKNLHNTPYQVLDYLKSELNIIREEIEVTNRKSPLEEFLIHQLDKLSVAKSQEDFGILEQIQTEITDTRGKIEERLSILLKQAEQFEKLDKAISDLKKLIEQLTEQVTQQPQIDPNKADAHYEELKKLIEKLTEQPQIDPNKADAHYKELKKLIEKLTEQIKPLSQIDQVKFIKKTDTAVSQAVGLLKQADNKFETLDETIHHFGKNSEEKLETISEQLKDLEIAPTIKEIDIKRISAVTSEEIEQKLKNLRRGISRATLKKEIVKILKDTHDSDLIKNTDDLISSIEDKKEILSDLLTHTLDKSGGFGNFAGRIEKVEKELKLFKKKFPDHLAHILPILLAKTLDRSEIFPNLVRKIEVIENKLDRFEIMNNISDILVDALDKSAIFNNLMKSIQNIEDKFSDFSQPDHKSRKQ